MTVDADVDLSADRSFAFRPGSDPLSLLLYYGLCCPASWTAEQVAHDANLRNPAGTTHGWVVTETDGRLPENPVICSDDPNRRHWVLNC